MAVGTAVGVRTTLVIDNRNMIYGRIRSLVNYNVIDHVSMDSSVRLIGK